MYKVIDKERSTEFANLDLAMAFAKELNVFVTIQGGEFEIVGVFGVTASKTVSVQTVLDMIGTRLAGLGESKRKDKI